MKTFLIWLTCFVCAVGVSAQNIQVVYVTEIPTVQNLGIPLSITADRNGGIYYTIFSTPRPNETGCYYIANPLDVPPPEQHLLVDDGLDTNVPNGRGFEAVSVDSQGNVFLALESGATTTSSVVKRSPAPNFQPVDAFGTGGKVLPGKRMTSVNCISDNVLVLTTFNTVEFWSAVDGSLLHEVTGGDNYQRDTAYNPITHDIYIAKNRDVSGIPISSAAILSGGNPTNVEGYTTIAQNFIPQGGAGGAFGRNGQLIGYDPVNDLIMIPSYSPPAPLPEGETYTPVLHFYSPADTSAPVATVNAAESPVGPLTEPSDAVASRVGDTTYVYVTDVNRTVAENPVKRIVVFKIVTGSEISDWQLF